MSRRRSRRRRRSRSRSTSRRRSKRKSESTSIITNVKIKSIRYFHLGKKFLIQIIKYEGWLLFVIRIRVIHSIFILEGNCTFKRAISMKAGR